jgi:hypothetical protein
MSFSAGTKVLLANGATVPIASLKPGDKVLATNTKTGKTKIETITAVMVHHDTNLYDLKIKAGDRTAVIDTTSNHLFWDQTTSRWIKSCRPQVGRDTFPAHSSRRRAALRQSLETWTLPVSGFL